MKKVLSIILSVVMLMSVIGGLNINAFASQKRSVDVSIKITENYNYANRVLKLVNKERAKVGASALKMDKDLYSAAMRRAAETVTYFSHTRPNGSDCRTACSKMSGENIAAVSSTPEAVMKEWMNSSGHKANILRTSYKSIGVGCVKYGNVYYWVQCFGKGAAKSVSKSGTVGKTASISVSKSFFELHYNSISSFGEWFIDDEYRIEIVGRNKGTKNCCYTIANSKLNLSSSNKSVFKINSDGRIIPVHKGTANLKVTLKADSTVTLTKKITITNVHNYSVLVSTTPASCIKNGSKVYKCKSCSATKTETVKARGYHNYNVLVKETPATCLGNGSKTYKCANCSATKTETVKARGYHNYNVLVKETPATCLGNGSKTYKCANCSATKTETVKARGYHNYNVLVKETPATCLVNGSKTYKCANCSATKTETVKARGYHNYNVLVKETPATCLVNGSKTYKCANCSATKTESVKARGYHNYSSEYIAGSCTEDSVRRYTCKDCGYSYKSVVSKAAGHKFYTVTEADCTKNGTQTTYCYCCDYKKTNTIPPTGHSYELYKEKDPNEVMDGYRYYRCPLCGDDYFESVPAVINTKKTDETVKFSKKTSENVNRVNIKITAPVTGKINKLSAGKKRFKAAWKKVAGASGYQLQYARNKGFTRGRKTVTVKYAKAGSKTVKKLKAKKKYYVRIRAYKTVNGKRVYGKWSKAKAVKTKA